MSLWELFGDDIERLEKIHACSGESCQVCALDPSAARPRYDSRQMALLPDEIEVRFVKFHHDNPQVYDALVNLAREWKQAGNEKCSIKMLFEILRWQYGIQTRTGEPFALSNDFTSRYARLIAANEPDLADIFHFRQLHGE